MAVIRVEKTQNYTVMSNYHLKDKELSLKSKGLLSMMLSLPDEWNYSVRGLASICKEGIECISNTLKELEHVGYMERRQLRDKNGRLRDTEYVIFEQPHTGTPCTGNPDTVKPNTGEPDTENRPQLNTKESINKKSNNHGLNIYQSINPNSLEKDTTPPTLDMIDKITAYRLIIKENIDYDSLIERYGVERLDEVVELILEIICSRREHIRIAGDDYPAEIVKSRLLKIGSLHVEYVFDCIDKNTTKVHNIKAYLLTSLYNAPVTMDSYYRAEVNHDLYGNNTPHGKR